MVTITLVTIRAICKSNRLSTFVLYNCELASIPAMLIISRSVLITSACDTPSVDTEGCHFLLDRINSDELIMAGMIICRTRQRAIQVAGVPALLEFLWAWRRGRVRYSVRARFHGCGGCFNGRSHGSHRCKCRRCSITLLILVLRG